MGFFNPEDCGSYVTCNADSEGQLQSHKVSCAPDLLFNAELKVCDWPENVPDCSIRSVPNDPNSPTPQPIVACTEDLQERGIPCFDAIMACADGTFRSECDPISETWWWTTQEVESEEFDCMEKEVGTYEHPDQCNMYYVCTGHNVQQRGWGVHVRGRSSLWWKAGEEELYPVRLEERVDVYFHSPKMAADKTQAELIVSLRQDILNKQSARSKK